MALPTDSKKSLGNRHNCKTCKTSFYDLGKPVPCCPVCDTIPFKFFKQKLDQKKETRQAKDGIAFVEIKLGKIETMVPSSASIEPADLKDDGWYAVFLSPDKPEAALYLKRPPLSGLRKFISGYFFKGLGEITARDIVDTFGMGLINILTNKRFNSEAKKSLTKNQIEILKSGWSKAKAIAFFDILFSELGFGGSQQKFLKDTFGAAFIPKVASDPFAVLQQVPRLQFTDMEAILKRLNIEVTDEQVILAAAHSRLERSEDRNRNTCAPVERLIESLDKETRFESSQIRDTLQKSGNLFHFFEQETVPFIETKASQNRDSAIVSELNRISAKFSRKGDGRSFIRSELETTSDTKLSDEQIEAINNSINRPVNVITGGPGSGKTTMVVGLVRALESLNLKVKLCAPTGRAAKRIAETSTLRKLSPSTIHRYLASPEGRGDKHYDVMIVDESSMIDINLLLLLLKTVPNGASIVFIGDADQLPSIGPGQVFEDIMASGKVSVNQLTSNYRQSHLSQIALAAGSVIRGEMPDLQNNLDDVDFAFIEADPENVADVILHNLFEKMPKSILGATAEDIQILSPMHAGSAGISNLNRLVQHRTTKQGQALYSRIENGNPLEFYATDRVIMKSNNYDLGVMNGDIGYVIGADKDNIICEFNNKRVKLSPDQLQDLDLAYAISIHKSQGSEYPGVIMPVTTGHTKMLSRRLLYTAMTRGKQQVLMVGQQSILRHALSRFMVDTRYTNLRNVIDKI